MWVHAGGEGRAAAQSPARPPAETDEDQFAQLLAKLEAIVAAGGTGGAAPHELSHTVEMLKKLRLERRSCGQGGYHRASTEEQQALDAYASREQLIESALLRNGGAPLAAHLYEERDYHLLHLSDELLREEYLKQTKRFLDEGAPTALRRNAETLVLKIGEVVDKPRRLRVQRAEQQRVGAADLKALEESRERDRKLEAARHKAKEHANEQAFWKTHAELAAAMRHPDEDRERLQRLCHRHELQLILMTSSELKALTQRQMQAWGTGGLEPLELRAVFFAMNRARLSGKSAQQFFLQLADRVDQLPRQVAGGMLDRAPSGAAKHRPTVSL